MLKPLQFQNTVDNNKKRVRKQMLKSMVYVGTLCHQAWVIHDYCTRVEPGLGVCLGMLKSPDNHHRVSDMLVKNLDEILNSSRVLHKNTNDALGFVQTVAFAAGPTAPAPGEQDEIVLKA